MTAVFSYAFRPLFLLMATYAILIIPFWVAAWLGAHPSPESLGTPTWWHAHEMIFGFGGAAVGGFLLTAVATWTQRPPVAGLPLVILAVSWLVARVLFLSSPGLLVGVAVAADIGYWILLCALLGREILAARSRRNYKVLAILVLMIAADTTFYVSLATGASWTMASLWAGVWLLVLLINLIGGRIIPAFTRNWLVRTLHLGQREPAALPSPFGRLDLLATLLLVAFALLDVLRAPAALRAASGMVTGLFLLARLLRWQGRRTLREPLVWILHLAFAWIPVGVLLLSAAALGLAPRTAGIHALTSGAITTMIVAVASRAALGHTGRPLRSHPLLTAAYTWITIAAVTRVVATIGPAARPLLITSATTWALGFLCFAARYTPILLGDTQPPGK